MSNTYHSQMLNFLDIDLSPYLQPQTSIANQTNVSNNTLFSSNPNLAFNDCTQAQSSLNEYSYSLDHLLNKDDLNLTGFMLEQEQVQAQAQPILRTRLSAPVKLSSSTSCTYLSEFYQQQQQLSQSSNQPSLATILSSNSGIQNTNQIPAQKPQTRSSLPNSMNGHQHQQTQGYHQIYSSYSPNQAEFSPNQDQLFQIDDFNMPTPTDSTVDPLLVEQQQQQVQCNNNNQATLNNNFSQSNTSNSNFIQSAQIQCPPGLLSRSNSQPDLANTINFNNFNYYYNNSLSAISPVSYPAGYAHSHHHNHHHHQASMLLNSNKIRRFPSLTFKTSLSECGNDQDFYNFNINDYLNNQTNNTSCGNNTSFNNNNNNNNSNNVSFAPNSNEYSNSFNTNHTQSYSTTTSGVSSSSSLTATSQDDGLFLGIDAITDFLNKNTATCSDLFDELPDLEDLMSLVTFESSSSVSSSSAPPHSVISSGNSSVQSAQSTTTSNHQCNDLSMSNILTGNCVVACADSNHSARLTTSTLASSFINCNPMSNLYDYGDMESLMIDQHLTSNLNNNLTDGSLNSERTTRSAPPSPTPQRKKQRPTNLPWHKPWFVV